MDKKARPKTYLISVASSRWSSMASFGLVRDSSIVFLAGYVLIEYIFSCYDEVLSPGIIPMLDACTKRTIHQFCVFCLE